MKKKTILTKTINVPDGEQKDSQVAVIDGLLPLPKGSTFTMPTGTGSEIEYRVIEDPKTVIYPHSSKSSRGGWVEIDLRVEQVIDPNWVSPDDMNDGSGAG